MRIRKYKSLHSIQESVSRLINEGDLNHALQLIHDFVEHIFTEPLYVSQVFGSKTLDDLCRRIGQANLTKIKLENDEINHPQFNQTTFVYIVTKLHKSGGHT